MTIQRVGLACFSLLISAALASAESPTPEALVRKLASEQHPAREQALVELARTGATAVHPLLTAATSKDPELSWRATEALQIVGQTVDFQQEPAVKKAPPSQASRGTNKAEADIAKKVLSQWPMLRHNYAATQLELLGAEIADNPAAAYQSIEVMPGEGGFVPAGGVFFAGILPALPDDGPEMMPEAEEVLEAVKDELAEVEDPAPEDKRPLFGGLFKAFGRAAGRIIKHDDEAAEAVGEAVADAIMKGAAKPAKPRDVEFIEEPPAEPIDVDGVDMLVEGDVIELRALDLDEDVGVIHAFDGQIAEAPPSEELQPGMLRIGKEWRGGDAGLEYIAHLQQIHTVILRDAPLTDAALMQVSKLQSLNQLRISGTRFSSAALLKLHAQRPAMTITAVGPAVLGLAGSDKGRGLLVQQVSSESGAQRAGIDEQDLITKIDGLAVRSVNDVTLALYDKLPGRTVKVEYVRGGKRKVADVVLGDRENAAADVAVSSNLNTHEAHDIRTTILRAIRGPARAEAPILLPE